VKACFRATDDGAYDDTTFVMKSLLSYSTVTVFVCLTSSLMQEELDGMAKNYPDRFKIYYVLNQVYLYSL
jgi:hypothetical protein